MSLSNQDWERLHKNSERYKLNLGGIHRRNRMGERPGLGTGNSIEFQEHRPYQPGDDLRRLDWAAFARSGQRMIRLERQEVMPQLDLVIDLSKSMWGFTDLKKKFFEETLGFLLLLANESGIDTRCLLAGERLEVVRSSSSIEILSSLEKISGSGKYTLADFLPQIFQLKRPYASQIWISDFLFDHDPSLFVKSISSEIASWAILQIFDERDLYPQTELNCLLEECEQGKQLNLSLNEASIQNYILLIEKHIQHWQERTFACGGIFIKMTTLYSLEYFLTNDWIKLGLIEPR